MSNFITREVHAARRLIPCHLNLARKKDLHKNKSIEYEPTGRVKIFSASRREIPPSLSMLSTFISGEYGTRIINNLGAPSESSSFNQEVSTNWHLPARRSSMQPGNFTLRDFFQLPSDFRRYVAPECSMREKFEEIQLTRKPGELRELCWTERAGTFRRRLTESQCQC